MANISASQHKVFSETLNTSIKKLEALGLTEFTSKEIIKELKKGLFLLECIHAEYDAKTEQLKQLISQYQQIQNKARVKLRICQQICSKQLPY